jgi:hypothetical protein
MDSLLSIKFCNLLLIKMKIIYKLYLFKMEFIIKNKKNHD